MNKLLAILNSRTVAVWLLVALLAALVASTFLPNEITLTPDEWLALSKERPIYHRPAATIIHKHVHIRWRDGARCIPGRETGGSKKYGVC